MALLASAGGMAGEAASVTLWALQGRYTAAGVAARQMTTQLVAMAALVPLAS